MTSPKIERLVEIETPTGKRIVFGVPTDIRPVELEPPKWSITVRPPSPNDIRFTPIDLRSRVENKARELRTFPEKVRELLPVRDFRRELLPVRDFRSEVPVEPRTGRKISKQRRNLVAAPA
ncbi:MAG: hypothetical protein QXT13_07835 [Pyrobaculum sp.]